MIKNYLGESQFPTLINLALYSEYNYFCCPLKLRNFMVFLAFPSLLAVYVFVASKYVTATLYCDTRPFTFLMMVFCH